MKDIFDAYVLWPFGKKLSFELVMRVNTRNFTVGTLWNYPFIRWYIRTVSPQKFEVQIHSSLVYPAQQMTSIIDSMVNPETYTQFLVRSKTIPQKYFRWSWLLSRARSYILICSRRPANYSPTNLLRITLHGPPLGVKIAWLLNLMSVRLLSFNPKCPAEIR